MASMVQLIVPYSIQTGVFWPNFGLCWLFNHEDAMNTFFTSGYCRLPVSYVYHNPSISTVKGGYEYFVCDKKVNVLLDIFFGCFWLWNATLMLIMLGFMFYRLAMCCSCKFRRFKFDRLIKPSVRLFGLQLPKVTVNMMYESLTVADIYVL